MNSDKHVAYEIRRLDSALRLLDEQGLLVVGATPPTMSDSGIAFLESALVHVRNLLELVANEAKDPDTVRPPDLGITNWDSAAAAAQIGEDVERPSSDIWDDVCRYVVHISKSREDWSASFPLERIACSLVGVLREMVASVDDSANTLPEMSAALREWRWA